MKSLALHVLFGLSFASLAIAASATSPERKFTVVPLSNPRAVAVDAAGNLYVGDVDTATVHKITPDGDVTAIGGKGPSLADPICVAVDRAGNVFVADADGNAVYKVPAGGDAVALGKPAATGDTNFHTPTAVAVDAAGNVFVADNGNSCIRRIAPDGTVTTFAGKGGVAGTTDGKGGEARFATPRGIAVDPKGNVYVADEGNSNIRKITPDGVVSTLAGSTGQAAGSADGTGVTARFGGPRALTVDAAGNVFVADTDNNTIRKITPEGVVTTLAGKPGAAGKADGTDAAARFSEPRGIAVDADDNVFVADSGNGAIRQVTRDGVVTTIAAATKP